MARTPSPNLNQSKPSWSQIPDGRAVTARVDDTCRKLADTLRGCVMMLSGAHRREDACTDHQGVVTMKDQKLLDLSDLAVESIEVVPADSLDSAAYGHGMPELAASCSGDPRFQSRYLPEDWDWAEV